MAVCELQTSVENAEHLSAENTEHNTHPHTPAMQNILENRVDNRTESGI